MTNRFDDLIAVDADVEIVFMMLENVLIDVYPEIVSQLTRTYRIDRLNCIYI